MAFLPGLCGSLCHPCFVEGATCHGLVESALLAQQANRLSHRTTTIVSSPDGAGAMQPLNEVNATALIADFLSRQRR